MIIFFTLIFCFLIYDVIRWTTGQQTFSNFIRKTGEENPKFAVGIVALLVGLIAHFFL